MSIISDALKKARDARSQQSQASPANSSRPAAARQTYQAAAPVSTRPSLDRRPLAAAPSVRRRASLAPVFAMAFIAVVGALGLLAISRHDDESAAPVLQQIAKASAPAVAESSAASAPSSSPVEQAGSAQFAIEERTFFSRTQSPGFALSGIAQFQDNFVAVVNGHVVKAGDEIQGAKVVAISAKSVEMQSSAGERIVLEKSF